MELLEVINALNNLARTGWMLRGIPPAHAETVAQHTFTTALLTLYLAEKLAGVDTYKAVTMALIHDLPEASTGDIISHVKRQHPSIEEELERKFINKLGLEKARELYMEYIKQETLEAKLVKIADQLATYIQALEYKKRGYRVDDIIENTREKLKNYLEELGLTNLIENDQIMKLLNTRRYNPD